MFKSTLAGLATLALAIIPVAALATSAHAAPVAVIQASDIDTLSPEGARTFQQRADAATRKFCRAATAGQPGLREKAACKTAVRAEIAEKFEAHNMAVAAKRQANTLASR
ncbi:UrcA family protein [Phenylobacterium sp.]|uniref:UrcA family protein n=1 Tax=Phenylobacterium sp. TaxID=1871053 RepID=UPI002733DA26|nr:UrcA family protein [Phenylobacterium sp.]MDP3852993.1 UrcA family protein [Phenylobacterium sp.]